MVVDQLVDCSLPIPVVPFSDVFYSNKLARSLIKFGTEGADRGEVMVMIKTRQWVNQFSNFTKLWNFIEIMMAIRFLTYKLELFDVGKMSNVEQKIRDSFDGKL